MPGKIYRARWYYMNAKEQARIQIVDAEEGEEENQQI